MMSLSLRSFARHLPTFIASPLRRLRDVLLNPSRVLWIRRHYTPHGLAIKEFAILSIARQLNINRPIEGYWFEFGCCDANTMRMAWKHTRYLFNLTYVGFDSFQGFPDIHEIDRQAIWVRGGSSISEEAFRRLCERAGMPRERLITVPGFYENSLTASTAHELRAKKAAVIYIDCDLYKSTVPVLNFIVPFLQIGTVIAFDDWNCFHCDPGRGERRAWAEFVAAHPEFGFSEFLTAGDIKAFSCFRC
jgi:O-methyltransferase